MNHDLAIQRQVQALQSLNASLPGLFKDAMSRQRLDSIIEQTLFSPLEEEEIGFWFARFITIRRNLWSVVEHSLDATGGMERLSQRHDFQYFVLGYSAVCSLIRMDRFLTSKIAYHTTVQRKLNEAFTRHRIERKQFHEIHKALVQPSNAIRIHQAHRILLRKSTAIQEAVHDSPVSDVFKKLSQQERFIDLSRRHYFVAWVRSFKLRWRRRGASAKQKSLFTVLEYGGRLASELALPRPKKVTASVLADVADMLQPGDIFITRHSRALTNLFLPGYWPHAALYVGHAHDQNQLELSVDPHHIRHWKNDHCTLEALKDGVHFRPLSETLCVDAFVVLRPQVSRHHISTALSRAVVHAGKGYNFDFDFFRSDQLVCTEVIYRAFDEIDQRRIPLQERMGRKTLSAEDLLDYALDSHWAQPIAIFGVGDASSSMITDHRVTQILEESYRSNR